MILKNNMQTLLIALYNDQNDGYCEDNGKTEVMLFFSLNNKKYRNNF